MFVDDDFWTFRMVESRKTECINLGSYNYLGFAENNGPCTEQAIEACHKYGLSACSSRHEIGTLEIHRQVQICCQFLKNFYNIVQFSVKNIIIAPKRHFSGKTCITRIKNVLNVEAAGMDVKVENFKAEFFYGH